MISKSELDLLLSRAGCKLSPEELEWLATAWEGYSSQLEALRALDLAGEDVATAFVTDGSPGGTPK